MPPKSKATAEPARKSSRSATVGASVRSGAGSGTSSKKTAGKGSGKRKKVEQESSSDEEDPGDAQVSEKKETKPAVKKKKTAPAKNQTKKAPSKKKKTVQTIVIDDSSDEDEEVVEADAEEEEVEHKPQGKGKGKAKLKNSGSTATQKTASKKASTKGKAKAPIVIDSSSPEHSDDQADQPVQTAPSGSKNNAKNEYEGGETKGSVKVVAKEAIGKVGKSTKKTKAKTKKEDDPPFEATRLKHFFEKYQDPETPGTIGPEGYERLCGAVGLDMEGIGPLLLAYVLGSSLMAHVSEPEFVGSLTTWAVDGEHKLAKLVEQVEEQVGRRMDGRMQVKPVTSSSVNGTNSYVNGASSIVNGGYGAAAGAQPQQKNEDLSFKSFYAFLFRTIKEPLQRLVPWDAAKAVWEIVWAGLEEGSTGAQVGKDFVEFLTVGKADGEKVRGVNKDVWEQTLEFMQTCTLDQADKLQGYSENDSWPLLMDEYAKWVNEGRPKKVVELEAPNGKADGVEG